MNCRNMRVYLDYGNILYLLHTIFDFTEDPAYFEVYQKLGVKMYRSKINEETRFVPNTKNIQINIVNYEVLLNVQRNDCPVKLTDVTHMMPCQQYLFNELEVLNQMNQKNQFQLVNMFSHSKQNCYSSVLQNFNYIPPELISKNLNTRSSIDPNGVLEKYNITEARSKY